MTSTDNKSSSSDDEFLSFVQSRGFIGQEPLLRSIQIRNLSPRISVVGQPGSGRRRLIAEIAAFLERPLRTVYASEIVRPGTLDKLLNSSQGAVLCFHNAYQIPPDIEWAIRGHTSTSQSCNIFYTVTPEEEGFIRATRYRFGRYSSEELKRIATACVRDLSLQITDEQVSLIVDITAFDWVRGTAVTTAMSERRDRTNQPDAVICALYEASDEGASDWIARNAAPHPQQPVGLKQTIGRQVSLEEVAEHNSNEEAFRAFIMTLSGRDFEGLMCTTLTGLGYSVMWSSSGKDGGIDIIANSNDLLGGGKFLFQCKRYQETSRIGRPVLQEFCGAAHHMTNSIRALSSSQPRHSRKTPNSTRGRLGLD